METPQFEETYKSPECIMVTVFIDQSILAESDFLENPEDGGIVDW